MTIETLLNAIKKGSLEEVKGHFSGSRVFLDENKESCFAINGDDIEEEKFSFSTAYLVAHGKTDILFFLQGEENKLFSQVPKASDGNLDGDKAEEEITQSLQIPTNAPKTLADDIQLPRAPTGDLESDKADREMSVQPKENDSYKLNPLGEPAASPLHFVICRIKRINAVIKDPDTDKQTRKAFQKERKKLLKKASDLIITKKNINIQDEENGESALHLAAEYGLTQVVRQLLQREGQKITEEDIRKARYDLVTQITGNGEIQAKGQKKEFLEKTDINLQDHNGKTALHYAVENGYNEVVKLLHKAGAKIIPDRGGQTPLHIAAKKDDIEVLELFLGKIDTKTLKERVKQLSENFNKKLDEYVEDTLTRKDQKKNAVHCDQSGQALLHLAAKSGHLEIVDFLLKKGANFDIRDNSDKTPLECAIESLKALDKNDKEKVIKFINIIKLLTNQPLQNIEHYLKETKLHTLAENGASKNELASLLKDKDIDINSQNILGKTALHIAILSGNTEMVGLLLEESADPSQQDVFGNTALHYAVPRGDVKSVTLLCKHGADSTIMNLQDKKPVDLVAEYTKQNKGKQNKSLNLLFSLTGIGLFLYYSIQIAQYNWYITTALGFAGLLAGLIVSMVINKVVQGICSWHIESSMKKELESCQEKLNKLEQNGEVQEDKPSNTIKEVLPGLEKQSENAI